MTALLLPPNIESLTSEFLRDQPEVVAIFAARVYTVLPSNVTFPAARVNLYDTEHRTQRPLYLTTHSLDVNVWADSKAVAERGLRTIMAAMSERMLGRYESTNGDDAVVTRVAFRGMADRPDETFTPAKPRFLVTALVTAHPLR